jgi:hypothetical protein
MLWTKSQRPDGRLVLLIHAMGCPLFYTVLAL